jgi:hypothetical protein
MEPEGRNEDYGDGGEQVFIPLPVTGLCDTTSSSVLPRIGDSIRYRLI